EELEYRHVRRQPRSERCRARAALEPGHARLECRAVGRSFATVAVASRVGTVRIALESRTEVDRLRHGSRRRLGRMCGVDAQGVEPGVLLHVELPRLSAPGAPRAGFARPRGRPAYTNAAAAPLWGV